MNVFSPMIRQVIQISILTAVCVTIFYNTLPNDFVWDDPFVIRDNAYIRDLKNIPLFFTPRYWNELHPCPGPYRPIRTVSFAVDYYFWRLNPFGYHVTNIMLHTLNVVLIFYLVTIIIGRSAAHTGQAAPDRHFLLSVPFLTALFFATHPIHTESMAYIKNRSDLLALLFFLLSLLTVIKYIFPAGKKLRRPFCFDSRMAVAVPAAWLFFVAAVFSKETALTLPGVMILYLVCFSTGPERRQHSGTVLFFMIIALACFWFMQTAVSAETTAAYPSPVPTGGFQHALAVIKTFGCYIMMLTAPVRLNAELAFALPESLLEPAVFLSLLALLFICAWGTGAYRHSPAVLFALGWILITLLPAGNILYLESRPIAEQRLYIPSLGFCLLLAYGMNRLSGAGAIHRFPVKPVMIAGFLTIITAGLYAAATVRRNFDWRDEITFYTRTIAANPHSPRIHNNLGAALHEAGQPEKAFDHFQTALKLEPDFVEARISLGLLLMEAGKYEEAIRHYRIALESQPDHVQAHNNLGVALYRTGHPEKARRHFQAALRSDPDYAEAHANMGDLLIGQERFEEGLGYYAAALRLKPDFHGVFHRAAGLLANQGNDEASIQFYLDLLTVYPETGMLNFNLACLYARQGEIDQALFHLQQAVDKDFSDLDALRTAPDLDNIRGSDEYRRIKDSFTP